MNIFKNLTEVQNVVKYYSTITKLSIVAIVVIVVGIYIISTIHSQKSKDIIYILTPSGDALVATQTSVRENRKIEAEAHARLFIMQFFDIDKFNFEQKINQSYDLGTSCIYNLHQKLVKDNWFTNMVQYNIIQTVIVESIEATTDMTPYLVKTNFKIHITSEATSEMEYRIEMIFTVKEGKQRSQKNPHALMIENIEVLNFSENINH